MNKTNIHLSYTTIKTMGKGSSMTVSKFYSVNKNVVNKRNEGFGGSHGDCSSNINGVQWVDDRDITDSDSRMKTNR
ncbi:hypothetical protein CN378_05055 [Bacillus sp. AFS015802]|uniref:hypothetical protein n=1 Tax=Bacillus sp. AFS015802 TaxID=2033486 RepID=UPI000BF5C278|nr:hypothetical protein [Bacillus sp. AFS015802]PFA69244.1 hypothetical protein CN378_05055 [Bacillus sp. AFS015802]